MVVYSPFLKCFPQMNTKIYLHRQLNSICRFLLFLKKIIHSCHTNVDININCFVVVFLN